MPSILPVIALGTTVLIDMSRLSADDERAVRAAWRDAATADTRDAAATVVARRAAAASVSTDSMLQSLSQQVTLAAIETRRGELWMLHAAGVADDAGRVVALVGPSGRGKTTAALALGARFAYVSDETVAIDLDGRVWPYRKPLSVIEDLQRPKEQRAASDAGLRALPAEPLTLAAIAVLDRRDDGPDVPLVEIEDLGEALGELVAQTSYLTDLAGPLRTIAAYAAATGGVRRVVYREAASLGPVIAALLDGSPLAEPPPAGPSLAEPVEALPTAETPGEGWSRVPVRDAIALTDPDRIAVLQVGAGGTGGTGGTGMVRVLAGVAPAIWRAADAASLDELTEAAVAAHGSPDGEDPADRVAAVVAELAAVGLLVEA